MRRTFFTVNLASHLTFNQDRGCKERALLKVGGVLMTNITANVLRRLEGVGWTAVVNVKDEPYHAFFFGFVFCFFSPPEVVKDAGPLSGHFLLLPG